MRIIGRKNDRRTLPADNPTATLFLDESGVISQDRFFAVGCLKLPVPSLLTRGIQKLRDKEQWYNEFHWYEVTQGALPVYKRAIDVVASIADARFSCFVADRSQADPVKRFGSEWVAYEKLAEQLLIGSIRPWEVVNVLADDYSTPDGVDFEGDIKHYVNDRLDKRLAVASVCRLNSKSADALQLVDLLTAGIAFEFRQAEGLAGKNSPKARLAGYLREAFGIPSALNGFTNDRVNIKIYGH